MVELSLQYRMREADVGSQSTDTTKLGFSSCSTKHRAALTAVCFTCRSIQPTRRLEAASRQRARPASSLARPGRYHVARKRMVAFDLITTPKYPYRILFRQP